MLSPSLNLRSFLRASSFTLTNTSLEDNKVFSPTDQHFSPDNSYASTECTLSDDSKEDIIMSTKSKHQLMIERRHRNFEVKKKTELCKTFQLGYVCPYGKRCSFAHGVDELRSRTLVSNKYKTTECQQFFGQGYCNYGPRCQFLHRSQISPNVSKIKINYQNIHSGVEAAAEYQEKNAGHADDIKQFLDQTLDLAKFNLRQLEVFESCLDP